MTKEWVTCGNKGSSPRRPAAVRGSFYAPPTSRGWAGAGACEAGKVKPGANLRTDSMVTVLQTSPCTAAHHTEEHSQNSPDHSGYSTQGRYFQNPTTRIPKRSTPTLTRYARERQFREGEHVLQRKAGAVCNLQLRECGQRGQPPQARPRQTFQPAHVQAAQAREAGHL